VQRRNARRGLALGAALPPRFHRIFRIFAAGDGGARQLGARKQHGQNGETRLRKRELGVWLGWAGLVLSLAWSTPGGAQTVLDRRMQALEPQTRLIQLCNLSGLETFAKDKRVAKVDRVRIDALAAPTVESNVAKGAGGAVRTGGRWYKFSYRCVFSNDRMRATHFSYVLDKEIPKTQWERFNLF
jgi:Domain of Unknown Function (DUF930)